MSAPSGAAPPIGGCYTVIVKITPSTQTLILASDRRGSSNLTGAASASKAGATGSVLSRVTIVATQPDAGVVYLRADYSPDAADAIGGPSNYGDRASGVSGRTVAGVSSASTAVAVRPQTSSVVTRATRNSANTSFLNLKPTEQYAFTQRLLTAAPALQSIDEYA
jgi:hypothetical protein